MFLQMNSSFVSVAGFCHRATMTTKKEQSLHRYVTLAAQWTSQ